MQHDSDSDMSHLKGPRDLRDRVGHALYGDAAGGRSFSDEQAKLLVQVEKERRPVTARGWHKRWSNLTCYTVIDCRPETAEDIARAAEARTSAEPRDYRHCGIRRADCARLDR